LGIALNAAAFIILTLGANLLSAVLALFGTLFYIMAYTKWIKRRTTHNASIAAVAWAIPVLVGWAAATGGLSLEVLVLFGIILYWAPPYYWCQGVIYRREYKRAGIPLLPVVHGDRPARAQIMAYSVMLFLISLVPVILGLLYTFYGLAALSLGGLLLIYALYLSKNPGVKPALLLCKYTQIYFMLLFVSMILDRVAF
jgi:protoheme IX farnesyltransferase